MANLNFHCSACDLDFFVHKYRSQTSKDQSGKIFMKYLDAYNKNIVCPQCSSSNIDKRGEIQHFTAKTDSQNL